MSLPTITAPIIRLNNQDKTTSGINEFAQDVLTGLSKKQKTLSSRFFYDGQGSRLFQQIMDLPEYYLTRCEYQILTEHKSSICREMAAKGFFHLVDLGAGDAFKTKLLMQELVQQADAFEYVPVDISEDAMLTLAQKLNTEMPQVKMQAVVGDYFGALEWLYKNKHEPKVILFLGSNIGNFTHNESISFLQHIRQFMQPGDQLLLGVDLRKDPKVIIPAYADASGITAAFNLNLLHRINHELKADFAVEQFQHHALYNPLDGMMQSFLISRIKQEVTIAALQQSFHFDAWEAIHTENSHKYTLQGVAEMASESNYSIETVYQDKQKYFADILLVAN